MRGCAAVRGGFTMVELLIVILGTLVLGAVILTAYTTTLQGLSLLSAKVAATSALRTTAEQLQRDIQSASGTIGFCNGFILTTPADGIASSARLVLDTSSAAPPVTRLYYACAGGTTSCIPTSPGTLQRFRITIAAGCADPVLDRAVTNVSSFGFTAQGANALQTRLQIRRVSSQFTVDELVIMKHQMRN